MKKKVCVVTGTRAEYGLLRPVIEKINNDVELELQLVATGMHLSPEFGLTYKEIERDGYKIDERVEMLLSSDTAVGISKSLGLGIIGFADVYEILKPDMIVLLGDRFEIFAATSAGMVAGVPISHIHGGETGAGTIDNMLRHAITKFSSFHFTSTEPYRKRVIQLGENPDTVFNVGSLGVENIKNLKLLSKVELEKELNFIIDNKTVLVTFHPLSLEPHLAKDEFNEILKAFDKIEGLRVIFTKSNSDTGGRIINKMIDDYVVENPNTTISFSSLGTLRYLSAAKYVKTVVGNSSSGIIEVPSLNTYTLNVGKRQEGRIQGDSIYNCNPVAEDVYRCLSLIIDAPKLSKVNNPYEKSNTSLNITSIIKEKIILNKYEKKFYDIEF